MTTTYTYEIVEQSGPGAHVVVQRVYPCKCGATHRGTDANETWYSHSVCPHKTIASFGGVGFCDQCARTFEIV